MDFEFSVVSDVLAVGVAILFHFPHEFEASRAFPDFSPPQYGWGHLFCQKWFWRGPLRAGHGIPSSTEGISDLVATSLEGFSPDHKKGYQGCLLSR